MAQMRVGLMGFGTIGRHFFRSIYKRDDIRVAAISDIADHTGLEYLLRFDTIMGRFPDEVSIKAGHLYVAGRQIPMLSLKEPGAAGGPPGARSPARHPVRAAQRAA